MPQINGTTKGGINWNAGRSSRSIGDVVVDVGAGLALALSWKANGSVIWAIIHMMFGWVYVAWNLIVVRDLF